MQCFLTATIMFAIVAFLSGCNTVSVKAHQYLSTPAYLRTDPATVQILQNEPTRPHERIGEIRLEPNGDPLRAEMEMKLKDAAAGMGADAVFIKEDTTIVTGSYMIGPWWAPEISPRYGRVITAIAIKYLK